ncbi:MAG TPA: peptide-binding protein [Bdellovibrionota bacterium]|nr:peptide-binding protein [Bdellovibrionota bacterium]
MRNLWIFLSLLTLTAAPAHAGKPLGNPNAPQGGTLYLNLGGEPSTLNPITSSDLYATKAQSYAMEKLLGRNVETYDWEPQLAEKWTVSKDGKVFTFTIRKGVKWHDGQPLTVQDVKFSFDVIFNDKYHTAHLRPYYEGLEKCEIVDDHTVKFTAKTKYFRNFDSAAELTVVPKHLYEDPDKGPKMAKVLVGTGAYQMDDYERGTRLVLKRNKDWWGNGLADHKGEANFDKIVLRFVESRQTSLEMLKKGDLDFIEMDPETYTQQATGAEWGKKVLKLKVETLAPKGTPFIGWNMKSPLFSDKKVRKALTYLVNRNLMIQKFRFGMSVPGTGPWYLQSAYASPKVKAIPFDTKKGLALLKEAGWADTDKDGTLDKVIDGKKTPFSFTLITAAEDRMKYFTMFKEDAKQAGVDVNLKLVEWNSFVKLLDERKFDAVALAWGGGSVDVDPKQIWHSASIANAGSNFVSYSNPEVDKLIDEARETMDRPGRIKKMRKVYEDIADDAPYVWLYVDKFDLYGRTGRMGVVKDAYKYSVGTGYWWLKP